MAECSLPRELTADEQAKLEADKELVSSFRRKKFEQEARKHWDLFYKRNTTHFFKDRHWTTREFEELTTNCSSARKVLLEAGCGVGNFFFPLLEEKINVEVYACDFSPRAIGFVKEHPLYDASHVHAFVCDIVKDDLSEHVPASSVDIATLIFVLSAIEIGNMLQAVKQIYAALKPGGVCLLRDYGIYDHAMLRFAQGHKLEENFYLRQDGTRAYYFSLEKVAELFVGCGFEVLSNEYVHRTTENKKEGLCVPRIFVQARLRKPVGTST